jgi:hypothetical protein
MDLTAHLFKPFVIVRCESFIALFLQISDFGFDLGHVCAYCVVVRVSVNAQSIADRYDQMLLVELRVAHHSLVLDACGDLAQLGYGLVLEFFKSVISHDFDSPF